MNPRCRTVQETTAAVRTLRQILQQEKEEHDEAMQTKKKTMAVLKEQLKKVRRPSTSLPQGFMCRCETSVPLPFLCPGQVADWD